MEVWDALDRNRQKTGQIIERSVPLPEDIYHLVVDIWIRNHKGEWLIAQRAPDKTHPNLWASTGGSAIAGEESIEAAFRETLEEIGLDLSPYKGGLLMTHRRDDGPNRCFKDIYLFEANISLESLKLQEEEVSAVKWASEDEIKIMIEDGRFVTTLEYLDDLFRLAKETDLDNL